MLPLLWPQQAEGEESCVNPFTATNGFAVAIGYALQLAPEAAIELLHVVS